MLARSLCLGLATFALAGFSCAEVDSPNPEIVLPSDYRMSFVQVRGCRNSVEHDLQHIIVRTRPATAMVYDQGPYPFEAGTLIVKEQYADSSCEALTGYTVMKKESPGTNPATGDWRFLKLDQRQRVVDAGPRCLACHSTCGGRKRDGVCAEP